MMSPKSHRSDAKRYRQKADARPDSTAHLIAQADNDQAAAI
jgi:hypothetical protein